MEEFKGLSNKELKELIVERLTEAGINTRLIAMDVKKGKEVVVRGEVNSSDEKDVILGVLEEFIEPENVTEGLIVMEDIEKDFSDEDPYKEDDSDFYDEDNESMGTQDIFRSVEEGMPYIPPTRPSYTSGTESSRGKKRNRKS